MSSRFEAASWPTSLKVVSFAATALLIGIFWFIAARLPSDPVGRTVRPFAPVIPLLIIVPALLFMVTGYEIDRRELRVRRLFWSTAVPLQGLTRIWSDPEAMRKSLRVWGNGGLYAITGLYQNKALGRYRAFVTDPGSAVVMVLHNRTVVVSPENPDGFVDYIRYLFPTVRTGSE